jgi:hypothetical protein
MTVPDFINYERLVMSSKIPRTGGDGPWEAHLGHRQGRLLRQSLVERPLILVERTGDDLDGSIGKVEDPLAVDLGCLQATEHDRLEDDLEGRIVATKTGLQPSFKRKGRQKRRGGEETNLQLLHGVLCSTGLDGLGDLLAEGIPVVERSNSEEGEEGVQLVDVVLSRRRRGFLSAAATKMIGE